MSIEFCIDPLTDCGTSNIQELIAANNDLGGGWIRSITTGDGMTASAAITEVGVGLPFDGSDIGSLE